MATDAKRAALSKADKAVEPKLVQQEVSKLKAKIDADVEMYHNQLAVAEAELAQWLADNHELWELETKVSRANDALDDVTLKIEEADEAANYFRSQGKAGESGAKEAIGLGELYKERLERRQHVADGHNNKLRAYLAEHLEYATLVADVYAAETNLARAEDIQDILMAQLDDETAH